jgi:site-specific DNA-methyltransferase (adenine-specific)
MRTHTLHHGCCLDVLRKMADNSVDSIVTDPPYGLSFMGKKWDYDVPSTEVWAECLRVLKPGGHLLAFAGTRTQHRMCCRIEDAGFEIRDMIAWVYGSGFPKSLDIGKAIDNAAGAERTLIPRTRFDGKGTGKEGASFNACDVSRMSGPAITPEAIKHRGWGTALKPALEPITLARKPLCGNVAANVLKWGTGGINVDKCRVEAGSDLKPVFSGAKGEEQADFGSGTVFGNSGKYESVVSPLGRWPANLIHDGSEEVTGLFSQSKAGKVNTDLTRHSEDGIFSEGGWSGGQSKVQHGDSGSAARFFYCAKASRSERDAGCKDLEHNTPGEITGGREEGSAGLDNPRAGAGRTSGGKNVHPTVKPLALMRYLVRLITPPGGLCLDPFLGSGTTAVAALQEGFRVIGIERDEHSHRTATHRVSDELMKSL